MMKFQRCYFAAGFLLAAPALALSQPAPPPPGHGFPGGKPIDTAGFILGMSGETAKPLLAAHYARQTRVAPSLVSEKMPYSNEAFISMAVNYTRPAVYDYDSMSIVFSGPRSGNQAFFIGRDVRYTKENRPNRAATLAALKQKFGGEPSNITMSGAMDYYFLQGNILREADKPNFNACKSGQNNLPAIDQPGPDPRRSLRDYLNVMQSNGGACDIFIRVSLGGSYDEVGSKSVENPDAIGRLTITMFDVTRFAATNAIDQNAIQAEQQKAQQSVPRGTGAPKL